jgi:hypothetical protein
VIEHKSSAPIAGRFTVIPVRLEMKNTAALGHSAVKSAVGRGRKPDPGPDSLE